MFSALLFSGFFRRSILGSLLEGTEASVRAQSHHHPRGRGDRQIMGTRHVHHQLGGQQSPQDDVLQQKSLDRFGQRHNDAEYKVSELISAKFRGKQEF